MVPRVVKIIETERRMVVPKESGDKEKGELLLTGYKVAVLKTNKSPRNGWQ